MISLSSLEHTLSAQGSASPAPTDLPLLIQNSDSIKQNESTHLITKDMDDTEGETADIFNRVREKKN